MLDHLKQHVKTPYRVLICYDHDNDNTLPALDARRGQEALERVKNTGRGAHGAVLSGFQASTSPYVLVFPADDTFNGGIIDRMVDQARAGCAIVCACRFMPGGTMEGCPFLKAFLVRTAAWTLRYIARLPARDATSGFRLFTRRVLEQIPIESTEGFTYSIELLVKSDRLGWKIGEVPALWFERKTGTSRFRVLRWIPAYLRWYFYAFGTHWLRRGPATVRTTR